MLRLGSTTLTRVGYVDIAIPPEVMGLTAAQFADVDWRFPIWAEGEQVRVGAATWFAQVGDLRLAFDPVQAADDTLRSDPATEMAHQVGIAQRLAAGGFARESIDRLVMTHIEGVGIAAWRDEAGKWSPFFPNARVSVSEVDLTVFLAADRSKVGALTYDAWRALLEAGVVDTYRDGEEVAAGVRAEITGAHCPGHAVFHFGSGTSAAGAPAATFLGHLAISPLHLTTGECPQQHPDPQAAWKALRRCADDGRLLIGPLWPSPGCGRWRDGAFEAGGGR